MADIAQTLDVRGLACPMPVVKTKLAIDKLEPGQVIEVLATDRGALVDIPAWAAATGHHMVEVRDEPDRLVFLVEK